MVPIRALTVIFNNILLYMKTSMLKLSTSLLLVFQIIISNKAFSQVGEELLFNSFYQGERNNCASIALIKASFSVYGVEGVFNRKEKINDTLWSVILKNYDTVIVSSSEVKKADSSAGFKLSDSSNAEIIKLKEDAVFIYCVMAKYKQKIDSDEDFETALNVLENGAWSPTIYRYLGYEVGKQIVPLRRLTGKNNCGVVAWSPNHAVFVCERYMDYHGSKKKVWAKYSGRCLVTK